MAMNFEDEKKLETFRSLIQISVSGLRLLAILNGGAAVALLAYLGNVAGKTAAVPDMRLSIGCYLFGLVLTGFAFVFSYLTQSRLFNELMGRAEHGFHERWQIAAFVLVVLGLVAFTVGSISAVKSFQIPAATGVSSMTPAQPEKK